MILHNYNTLLKAKTTATQIPTPVTEAFNKSSTQFALKIFDKYKDHEH